MGSDSGWNLKPSYDRSTPLGSAKDSIVTLAIGSAERSFELYLSPARFSTLLALLNTQQTFTDWERPLPESRSVFVADVSQKEWVAVLCSDGTTQKRVRVGISLVSQ